MAIVNVTSPAGKSYQFDISGNLPTPEEQAWIDQYVAQQEVPAQTEAPQDTGPDTSFLGAVRYGVDQPLENIATTSKILGGEGIASFFSGLTDAPTNYQSATEGFMNEGGKFYDFGYLPRAGVEQAGQFAGSLLSRFAGSVLGGAAGSVIPGVGTAAGAAAGAFAAPALLEAVQILGPVALTRAQNNGRTEPNADDFLAAAGTAAGSGALNAIAPGLTGIFKRILVEGGTEGLQSIIQQAGETAGTDVGLQIDQRQALAEAILGGTAAGIVDAPGAIIGGRSRRNAAAEEEAARKQRELLEDQQEDASSISEALRFGEAASTAVTGTPVTPTEEAAPSPLGLPAPDGTAPAAGAPTGPSAAPPASGGAATAKQAMAPVTGGMGEAARQAMAGRVAASDPITRGVSNPGILRQLARDPYYNTVQNPDGTVDIVGVKVDDASDWVGIAPVSAPSAKPSAPPAPASGTASGFDTAESYRRTIEDLNAQEQESTAAYRRAVEDARRESQTGKVEAARDFQRQADIHAARIAQARKTRIEVEGRLANQQRLGSVPTKEGITNQANRQRAVEFADAERVAQEAAVAGRNERMANSLTMREQQAKEMERQIAELQRANRKVQLPSSEKQRLDTLNQQLASQKQEIAALRRKMKNPQAAVEQAQAAREKRMADALAAQQVARQARQARQSQMAPAFTAKQSQVFANLRERLNKLNLKDVRLQGEQMIDPAGRRKDDLIEGTFDVDPDQKAVIALSMGIYDPNLTEDQLFDRLASVMNHEVIHALKRLGLLTDAEWKTLVEVAKRQNYVKSKDGKETKRSYTYFERAASMYSGQSAEIIEEESVAELFRDWLRGRVKVGGKPRTLMQKIKDFFKAIWGSHADAGLTSLDQIFSDIESGKIGARPRAATDMSDETARQSRAAAERAPQDPDFQRWASGPNGERVITDADGNPKVYYTGTSKDQDFTKFKVDKHGGWFTTDPNEASSYAVENDSMGFRRDGWDMKRTNTASRVMPVFLRAANPFTGPKPQSVLLQTNYKKAQTEWFESLRRQGYDAWMPEDTPSLAVMLNDPSQVKSVFARGADGKGDMRRYSLLSAKENEDGRPQQNDWRTEAGIPPVSETGNREAIEAAAQKFAARATAGTPEFGQLIPDDLDNLTPEFFKKDGWAVVTAFDKFLDRTDPNWGPRHNAKNNLRLRQWLEDNGVPYRVLEGKYQGISDGTSYLILADEPTARRLGMQYNQESVLTSRGLVYSMTDMPRTMPTGSISIGEEALKQDYVSYVENGDAFSLGLDFDSGAGTPDIGLGFYTRDDRPQLPIRRSDGKVELHHWTHVPDLKEIDPKFAGTSNANGTERGFERVSFFGINPRPDLLAQGTGYVKESILGPHEYIALVDPDGLYPYHLDPSGLAEGLDPRKNDFKTLYTKRIKDAGFKGYYLERVGNSNAYRGDTQDKGDVHLHLAAPQGNVACMFEPTPVKPASEVQLALRNQTRYSIRRGMTKPLTRAERGMTVLGRMDPARDYAFVQDNKKRTVLQAAQELLDARGGVVIEESDPDFITKVARMMLAEARAALVRNPGAIGWYGEKVALSKRLAAMLHPEISRYNPYSGALSNSYDSDAEHAWDYAMAVTSNGMAVLQNAKEANNQYEYWKQHGRFKEQGVGKQGVGMVSAFKFYNAMKDAGRTDAQIQVFLSQKTTPKALASHPIVRQLGMKVSSSEGANTEVYGSYLIGPKIGNGFYQNLRGNFDPLTMDLWFMRMFNRLTGKPFKPIKDALLQSNAQRVMREFENRDNWTDYERRTARAVLDDMAIDFITEENAADFAIKYDEVFQRDFMKMNDDAIKASGLDKKSDEAKRIGNEARPKTGQLTLATKRLHANATMTMDDAPSGSRQRALMREVVGQVRAVMAQNGDNISTADFQALMWYAEKQLLASMNVSGGQGGDNDYVDGAIELLRSKGISDAEIERGLPDTERDRLAYGTDAGRTAARVRAESSNAVQGGGGTGGVQAAPVGGRAAAAGRNGNQGVARQSMRSLRMSVSPTASQIGRAQKALMYARSADVIAKVLNLKGYGLEQKKAQRFVDGVLRRFQDNMLPVGRMIQELSANGMTITDAMDTYLQEELLSGTVGYLIRENRENLFKPTAEAVKRIKVSKPQIDDLIRITNPLAKNGRGFVSLAMEDTDSPRTVLADAYLYARHAKERNDYILANKNKNEPFGSGMTDAEADAILDWFSRLDPANRAAIAAIDSGVRAVVANTNKARLDAGLISQDVVDKNPYSYYVPLRGFTDNDDPRIEDMDDRTGPPSRPRFGARGKEDPKALGRSGYASDLLANVFTQNQNAILRGERNKVGQSFVRLVQSDPAATNGYARVLPVHPKMRTEGQNGQPVMINDPGVYTDPNMLIVKVDGKEVFVEFDDPRLAGALNGRNAMPVGAGEPLIRAMSAVNRYLANINTSYNPEFIIANFLRDLQTAGVNVAQFEKDGLSGKVIGSVPSAIKGIKRAIRNGDNSSEWSKIYQDFVANGGQNATNQFNSLADEMDGIRQILGDISDAGVRGRINKVRQGFLGKSVGSLLRVVEDYNTIVENGIRVATYKALLDSGFTPQRAAQAARNVTVNFAKGGDYRRFMGAWYLFYNASLQGSFALLNAAVRSGKVRKLWMSAVAVGFLMDQLNAMMSDDEDDDGKKDYDDIEKYTLEHNLIIPDFFGITDRSYFSIPLPYGLNMAYNAGRAISRAGRGEYTPGEATSTIFGTALNALNPLGDLEVVDGGGVEGWAKFVSPTVADPFIEVMQNKNYRGSPIYKENMPFDKTPLPESQLYWQTTSTIARSIADQLNTLTGGNKVRPGFIDMNPDIMEHWFDFLTGGVGTFVQRSAELPFRVSEEGGLTDELIRSVPFLRKAVGSTSSREDQTAYIENAKRVLLAGEELKKAREAGDAQWARDTIANYGTELRLLGLIRNTETALKKISGQRNEVSASVSLPEERKRELLDALDQRKEMLIQRANRAMADLQ